MELDHLHILGSIEISWARWIFTSLLVFGIYWVVRIADNIFKKASLLGGLSAQIYQVIHKAFVMAEPLSLLIILASFIFINPVVHGIMALILLLISYQILKSYFSGKVLQIKGELFVGQKIKVHQTEGFIQKIGRTNLTLQTKQGVEYLSYMQLFDHGYTQMQGEKIGGLQALIINCENVEQKLTITDIKDKLWQSPYLDWSFDPEVSITNIHNQFEIKVLLREKNHLEDFKNLINAWGYSCRLKN